MNAPGFFQLEVLRWFVVRRMSHQRDFGIERQELAPVFWPRSSGKVGVLPRDIQQSLIADQQAQAHTLVRSSILDGSDKPGPDHFGQQAVGQLAAQLYLFI